MNILIIRQIDNEYVDTNVNNTKEEVVILQSTVPIVAKFDINNVMISLLNVKGYSLALVLLILLVSNKYIGISNSYKILMVNRNAIRLWLFPLSFTTEATLSLTKQQSGPINTWQELKIKILEIFSLCRLLQLKGKSYNF